MPTINIRVTNRDKRLTIVIELNRYVIAGRPVNQRPYAGIQNRLQIPAHRGVQYLRVRRVVDLGLGPLGLQLDDINAGH